MCEESIRIATGGVDRVVVLLDGAVILELIRTEEFVTNREIWMDLEYKSMRYND